MSPFWYAHKINEPILLIHGEADNNSGTFPIQSERLYMALKGHGATVRYVTLPHEAHGYAARESNLHVVAETLNWLDKYVKNAPAQAADRLGVAMNVTAADKPGARVMAATSYTTLAAIREAAERIRRIARVTPLVDVSAAAGRPLLPQVREPAAGRRVQDSRRLQHGRAAHRRAAPRRRHHVFIRQSRAGDGARRARRSALRRSS